MPGAAVPSGRLSCLMLTSFPDDDALLDAVVAGASGYDAKRVRAARTSSAQSDRWPPDTHSTPLLGRAANGSAADGPGQAPSAT